MTIGERVHRRFLAATAVALAVVLTASGCALLARATTPTDGSAANGSSWSSSISGDGRYVAFVSEASNLVTGDANGAADVFVRDNETTTTALVSAALGGGPSNGESTRAAISASGRFVAFISTATNLVEDDGNGVADVFVWDRLTGSSERVSIDDTGQELSWPSGLEACAGDDPTSCVATGRGLAVNDDGSVVAFVSRDPSTGRPAILLRDRLQQRTTAPVVSAEVEGSARSRYVELAISGDGSTLAYVEEDLVTSADLGSVTPENVTLEVLDLDGGVSTAVSTPVAGPGSTRCCAPSLSTDGSQVAFVSNAVHTPENDETSGCPDEPSTCQLDDDVFVYDRHLASYERVSVDATGAEVDGDAADPSLSGDGARVLFTSSAAFVAGVPSGIQQVFVRDRTAATTTAVSMGIAGYANADSRGVLASSGRLLTLESQATTMPTGVAVTAPEIYTALADVPTVVGSEVIEAGASNVVVTLAGTGLTPALSATPASFDLSVNSATALGPDELRLDVSTIPGASLGPRQIVVTNHGPFGLTAATVCTCFEVSWDYTTGDPPADKPDIILINTDDQRGDSMWQLPLMESKGGWAKFANSFVEEPQCCPSRASLFSGQYAHHTGVTTLRLGASFDETTSVATALDGAGYRTFHGGKYLNGYPFPPKPRKPLGWDEFIGWSGASPLRPPDFPTGHHAYYWYRTFENDHMVEHGGAIADYSTDFYFGRARQFIRNADPNEPLFLYISPPSPHSPYVPAERHKGACASTSLPLPPNFGAYDTAGEPPWMEWATPYSVVGTTQQRRLTCEMLRSIDENVAALLTDLEAAGRLDNAYVVFTSDNGYGFGEHRLTGKGNLYEESIRVPLWVRGPGVMEGTVDRLTSNVDITPTILDWANVESSVPRDGQSFADDLEGVDLYPNPSRVLLYGCRSSALLGNTDCGGYREPMGTAWGVRTDRYKYVEYEDGYVQVFDLQVDPWELTNLAVDPANAGLVADLRNELIAARGDAAGISGLVIDKFGAPVAGIEVRVRPVGGDWALLTHTHATGRYNVMLAPGQYQVRFDDPSGRYRRQFYDRVGTVGSATIITAGFPTTIDAVLKPK